MSTPFSITLFSTTGDPNGIRHVDKSNWSGFGVVFSKDQLADLKGHSSFRQAGIYILVGNAAEETIYIGEADPVGDRLRNHKANKEVWSWGVYFVDTNHKIGKTEVQYLEYALMTLAKQCGRAILLNKNNVTLPSMSPVARATAHQFFCDMLLILPMLGISAFTAAAGLTHIEDPAHPVAVKDSDQFDTVVVPARADGFKARFINEHCWFAIRIHAKHIPKLKYIAAYQVAPVAAITHLAEIDKIEPYGDSGKYMLRFKGPAQAIAPIARGADSHITLQAPRYALRSKLLAAKNLDGVWV